MKSSIVFFTPRISREVFPEKLDKHLPNLQKRLADEGGQFAYLGICGRRVPQSATLTASAPTSRFQRIAARTEMFEEITLDSIRAGALGCVSTDLQPFLDEINTESGQRLRTTSQQRLPIPAACALHGRIHRPHPAGGEGQRFWRWPCMSSCTQTAGNQAGKPQADGGECRSSAKTGRVRSEIEQLSGTRERAGKVVARAICCTPEGDSRVFGEEPSGEPGDGHIHWRRSFIGSSIRCAPHLKMCHTSSRICGSSTSGFLITGI